MKSTLLSLSFVLTSFLSTSTAQAVTCYAQSQIAWGVGYSFSYYRARRIALHECRIRTPHWMYCYITGCSYYLNDNQPEASGDGGLLQDENNCLRSNYSESDNFDPACPAN